MVNLKTNYPSSIEYVKPVKMRELAKKGFDMRQVEKLSKAMAAVMSKNMLKAKPDSKNHIDIALEDSRRQIDLMKIDIGIINSNIGALQQDVKTSLGLLSETIESIKKLGSQLKEHANKIIANQQSSSSSVLDILTGAGLLGGLKTAGAAVKSGVSSAISGIGSAGKFVIGSAGKFAKGLGVAGLAASAYEAFDFYREQSDDLSKRYGDDWKQQLGGAAQKSYRMVTDREASLEEINRLTPQEAASVLENGYPKDIERYGRERLETRAKGQTVSATTTPSGGPEESKAVREKREEVEKQIRIDRSSNPISASTESNKLTTFEPTVPLSGIGSGPDAIQTSGLKPVAETGDATRAMQSFVADGWTKEQAAGIVGNLQAESGPNLKTDSVGDGGKAYGIAQWHPDRQADFKRVYKKDIREAGFDEQLAFIKWELANSEARAGRLLRQAKTASEAAIIMDRFYERSSGKHTAQRIVNAENLFKNSTAVSPVAAIQSATSDAVTAPPVVSSDLASNTGKTSAASNQTEINSTGTGGVSTPAAKPGDSGGQIGSPGMTIAGGAGVSTPTAMAVQAPFTSSVLNYSEGSTTKAGTSGNSLTAARVDASTVNTAAPIAGEVFNYKIINENRNKLNENSFENNKTNGAANLSKFNATGRPDALNFKQEFAGSLGSFLTAAKQSGHQIMIQSGFRSPELQSVLYKQAVQKYGNEAEARKWVAPPGQSNHGKGIAADLGFSSPAAKAWAHSNAQKFGLNFRMAHEPWHIEPTGVGGPAVDYNPDGVQTASPASSENNGGLVAEPVAAPTIAETKTKFSNMLSSMSALTPSAPQPIVRPSSPANSLEAAIQTPTQSTNNPMTGLVGAISNIGSMVGSMAGILSTALSNKQGYKDTPNPDLMHDENTRNFVPPAMPSSSVLAQLFDLNIGDRSKIPGYAFE